MITRQQYLTGKVRRWHTHHNMNQTNADHSWGVAMIILEMHPNPSVALIREAILHDAGEVLTGDVPGYTKIDNPEVKKLMDRKELEARNEIGFPQNPSLSDSDRRWLKYADALEAWLFVRHCSNLSEADTAEYFPAIGEKLLSAQKELQKAGEVH